MIITKYLEFRKFPEKKHFCNNAKSAPHIERRCKNNLCLMVKKGFMLHDLQYLNLVNKSLAAGGNFSQKANMEQG